MQRMVRKHTTSMIVIAGTIGAAVTPPHFKHQGDVIAMQRSTPHGLHVDQVDPDRPLIAPVVAAVTTGTVISPGTAAISMIGYAPSAVTTGSNG